MNTQFVKTMAKSRWPISRTEAGIAFKIDN